MRRSVGLSALTPTLAEKASKDVATSLDEWPSKECWEK